MHLAGRFAQQLYPSLKAEFPDAPSAALIEELLRMAGLLHDIGHGPFGHFFDDNFLADFGLTHELLGQRIIREEIGDLIRGLRRSPAAPFEPGEAIDPEWICYLMGKDATPAGGRASALARPSQAAAVGIYTADNMDYVLRDSYMCGVAVGPIDIERIIYYSFFSEKGLTLDRGGIQAFIMFLNARFYMYTNVYYHRTTRGIDLHLKEIFRDTMRLVFPYDLKQGPRSRTSTSPSGRCSRKSARWEHVGRSRAEGSRPGVAAHPRPPPQVAHVARGGPRPLRAAPGLRLHEGRGGRAARAGAPARRRCGTSRSRSTWRSRIRAPSIPSACRTGRSTSTTRPPRQVSAEPLKELLKYLPGKVAQCRIFATTHEHDQVLAEALNQALGEERSAHPTNL